LIAAGFIIDDIHKKCINVAMKWTVEFTGKAAKQRHKLPQRVADSLAALVVDIEELGPVRGDWLNYSKLSGTKHHCHLKKGNPTYFAIWQVDNDLINFIEVIYVGTHEKTKY